MNETHGIQITPRDRVLRAWENAAEAVRDYQNYAREMEDDGELARLFARYAEEEAFRASELLQLLHEFEA